MALRFFVASKDGCGSVANSQSLELNNSDLTPRFSWGRGKGGGEVKRRREAGEGAVLFSP